MVALVTMAAFPVRRAALKLPRRPTCLSESTRLEALGPTE